MKKVNNKRIQTTEPVSVSSVNFKSYVKCILSSPTLGEMFGFHNNLWGITHISLYEDSVKDDHIYQAYP